MPGTLEASKEASVADAEQEMGRAGSKSEGEEGVRAAHLRLR